MSKKPSRNNRRGTQHTSSRERIDDFVKDPLNSIGVSVFRKLGGCSLDRCGEAFNEYTNGVSKITRGEADQYGMALNIVSLLEVRLKSFVSSASTQSVINEIYDSIPSLRKPQTIGIEGIRMFGSSRAKMRSFGVAIHLDERHRIHDERDQVIEILNEHAQTPLTREDWPLNDVPHISIGKILMSSISDRQRKVLISHMNETLPEQVHLDRATLHNPAK